MKRKGEGEDTGYELSQREKMWQQRMDMMRRRIEHDPYEAIFGKRFEPFWSPLVPSWMREEMGLPTLQSTVKTTRDEANANALSVDDTSAIKSKKSTALPKAVVELTTSAPGEETKSTVGPAAQPTPPKSTSYAYASTTSWDSRSNKTRRVEWDSITDETKKYEYDPITNRMVQIQAPTFPANPFIANDATQAEPGAPVSPVQEPSDVRKVIPIPPPLSQPSHSVPIGFAPKPTSIGPVKSTALAPGVTKPAALAKTQDSQSLDEKSQKSQTTVQNIDTMTAEDVRARIPKPKQHSQVPPAARDTSLSSVKAQIEVMLKERDLVKQRMQASRRTSEWDKAEMDVLLHRELDSLNKKKEKLLKDEHGLFHIERQKSEIQKLNQRLQEVSKRLEKLSDTAAESKATRVSVNGDKSGHKLQPSLERMQSRRDDPVERSQDVEDADDAAAHESTEPIVSTSSALPRGWDKQADMLQADRVKRTTAKVSYPDMRTLVNSFSQGKPMPRTTSIPSLRELMSTRRTAVSARPNVATKAVRTEVTAERAAKLEKANAMLEDEIKEPEVPHASTRKSLRAQASITTW